MIYNALYLDGETHVRFDVWASASSLAVLFSGYYLNARGTVQAFAQQISPTADRAINSDTLKLGAGYLLSLTATLASGSASRGQCYVRARLQKSTGTPASVYATIVAGYLTNDYAPSFPWGKQEGPLDGSGLLRRFEGTNPAAGVEWSETVPTGARWRIYSIVVRLVTDANAGNRREIVSIQDTALTIDHLYRGASSMDQAANLTVDHVYAPTGYASPTGIQVPFTPMPETILLGAGVTITVSTSQLKAGDNWSAPQMLVEEWLEA